MQYVDASGVSRNGIVADGIQFEEYPQTEEGCPMTDNSAEGDRGLAGRPVRTNAAADQTADRRAAIGAGRRLDWSDSEEVTPSRMSMVNRPLIVRSWSGER